MYDADTDTGTESNTRVDGGDGGYLGGLDGVVLVVHRGGRASHVVDLVHLCPEGFGDVMPHELEVGAVEQVLAIRTQHAKEGGTKESTEERSNRTGGWGG